MTVVLVITPLKLSKVSVTPHTKKVRGDDPSLKNNYLSCDLHTQYLHKNAWKTKMF